MRSLVKLRPAARGDLPVLVRMAVAFNDEDGHPLSRGGRQALRALCAGTTHGRAYMIEAGKVCVGYVVIGLGFSVEYGGVDAFLDEFYVEKAHRGRGVGTAALLELNKIARKLKIKALHLEAMPANDRAARLYARLGYRLSERRLMSKRY
jgi:ribosomal protein S18 acetylase RimI-like enzyme